MKKIRNIVAVLFIIALCSFGLFPGPVSASVGNYVTSVYDGTLFVTDDNYTALLEETSGNVISTAQTFVVGQDNNTGDYYVYMGGMYFDTSAIPVDAVISAATLQIYIAADGSTTDFDIQVVKGATLTTPMDVTDFGKLQLMDEDLGHVGTAGISTAAYTTITLGAAGRNEIVRAGTTRLGLRSSLDVAETAPSGDEYVDIWSYEKGYGYYPILTVTYTEAALGTPTSFAIGPGGSTGRVAVYSNYVSENDQLYVFMADVNYPFTPSQSPQDQFYIQLLETDNTVIAQSVLPQWGYRPESFYLSADSAPNWGQTYIIQISDISTGLITVHYDLVAADWKGTTDAGLEHWCTTLAKQMESRDGVTAGTYISKGQITEEAGVFFTTGISLLSTQYPGLFSYIDYEIDEDSRDDTIVAPTNKWGADFQTAMGNFSTEVLHVPATAGKLVFCGFLFVLLPMGAGVGAFGVSAGGPIGSILGIALLVFFSSQGMIPVIAMVTLGVFLVVLGVYTFVMKG